MNKTKAFGFTNAAGKLFYTFITVALSILLPQIFHALGVLSGLGAGLGTALLPMQIPVILSGFLFGPAVGLVSGILSPLLSFAISGMPGPAVLPFITIELAAYGVCSGWISKFKLNTYLQLLIVQIAGRLFRIAAFAASVFVLDNGRLSANSVFSFIGAGLFGIVLQLALIPLLKEKLEELKR